MVVVVVYAFHSKIRYALVNAYNLSRQSIKTSMQNLEPVAQKMVIALGTKEDILGAAARPPPPADSRFCMKVLMDCPHKLSKICELTN